MYLSGEPLHVITLRTWCERSARRAARRADLVLGRRRRAELPRLRRRSGFTPITTCTDLLRPGGYGRLPKYLEKLEERMRARGVRTIGDFVVRRRAGPHATCPPGRCATRSSAAATAAPAPAAAAALRTIVRAAGCNTPVVLAADPRYRAAKNRAVPRKIGSQLWLFDCINCDKCVPVCPNDANFVYETAPCARAATSTTVVLAGSGARGAGRRSSR